MDSIESSERIGQALAEVELSTNYNIRGGLDRDLLQVSKIISTRVARKVERDFFFVQVGGWDHHSNMKNNVNTKFGELNRAFETFVAEMKAQNVWESVVFITESEFARTLDSNGGGSDHAWAGQHLVMSGGLEGGRVYNKFPAALHEGSPRDLGRGRLIPEYPWESIMVPVAQWLGVNDDQLVDVFPNIGKFNATHLNTDVQIFKEAEACDEALLGDLDADYRGCQATTRSGKSCQRWTAQSPHTHTRTPVIYPNSGLGDHNFCRNPDKETTIWCYTTDTDSRWEYCDPLTRA